MSYIIFALLIAVLIIEITVLIQAGGLIGLWPTLMVIFITAAIGAALLRSRGLALMYQAQEAIQRGELPLAQVLDGLCLLLAGSLLLAPGFVTDGVGFFLFVPPLRSLLGRGISWLITRHAHIHVRGGRGARAGVGSCDGKGTVINGDFEDITGHQDSATKDPSSVERRIE